MDIFRIIGILFWIPPLVVAIGVFVDQGGVWGLICGVIYGILIAVGEVVVLIPICMFLEWFTYDGRND